MTDDVDTTEVPTEPLVEHLVALAFEIGTYSDHVSPPERGNERDVEWSWSDIEWDVDSQPENGELLLYGFTEGEYQVQVRRAVTNAPPSKSHPAEHETRTMPIGVTIHYDIGEGSDLELGSPHVEVGMA